MRRFLLPGSLGLVFFLLAGVAGWRWLHQPVVDADEAWIVSTAVWHQRTGQWGSPIYLYRGVVDYPETLQFQRLWLVPMAWVGTMVHDDFLWMRGGSLCAVLFGIMVTMLAAGRWVDNRYASAMAGGLLALHPVTISTAGIVRGEAYLFAITAALIYAVTFVAGRRSLAWFVGALAGTSVCVHPNGFWLIFLVVGSVLASTGRMEQAVRSCAGAGISTMVLLLLTDPGQILHACRQINPWFSHGGPGVFLDNFGRAPAAVLGLLFGYGSGFFPRGALVPVPPHGPSALPLLWTLGIGGSVVVRELRPLGRALGVPLLVGVFLSVLVRPPWTGAYAVMWFPVLAVLGAAAFGVLWNRLVEDVGMTGRTSRPTEFVLLLMGIVVCAYLGWYSRSIVALGVATALGLCAMLRRWPPWWLVGVAMAGALGSVNILLLRSPVFVADARWLEWLQLTPLFGLLLVGLAPRKGDPLLGRKPGGTLSLWLAAWLAASTIAGTADNLRWWRQTCRADDFSSVVRSLRPWCGPGSKILGIPELWPYVAGRNVEFRECDSLRAGLTCASSLEPKVVRSIAGEFRPNLVLVDTWFRSEILGLGRIKWWRRRHPGCGPLEPVYTVPQHVLTSLATPIGRIDLVRLNWESR